MKKILLIILFCSLIIACKDKYAIEREKKEAAFQHQRDSLSNTDVQLSFMNIKVGGSKSQIDQAVSQDKIQIDSCINGIYVGSVVVPIMKDTTTFNSDAILRIGTVGSKVASIELYFPSYNSIYAEATFDFFVRTFCERYYDQHEEKFMSMGSDWDRYNWCFKNQTLSVIKESHKEVGYGNLGYNSKMKKNEYGITELDILDGISVEYKHERLYEQLMNSNRQTEIMQDSNQDDERRKAEAEKAKAEYRKNI